MTQSPLLSQEQKHAAASPQDDAAQACLRVQNVNFFYGKTQALSNITADINARHVTALIGPSGCGKSTFLRTLNRMNDLYPGVRLEGKITFNGMDIYARQVDVVQLRRRIGMVFQRPNPFPMSIRDNIAYGLRLHGERNRSRLEEIVTRTLQQAALWDEVKDHLNKSAFDLSGGQQQRLCIARTLAVEPDVILMDEPCSALDPNATASIEALIKELKSRYTVVVVTHNLQQAARISEMTGFFLKGELIEMEPTEKLFAEPRDRRTEDYIRGRFG